MSNDSLRDEDPSILADIRQTNPENLSAVFLGGLFVLALLAACYVASGIIMPIVLAGILKLVLQPVMRGLERVHVPRMLASVLLIFLILGLFVGLGVAFSGPASMWAHDLPTALPKLQEKLNPISSAVHAAHKVMARAEGLTATTDGAKTMTVAMAGTSLSDKLLAGTQRFASAFFEMIIVLFFMLMSGDMFLRRLVEILPRFQDKKQAITISQQIESDISAYLTTVTVMNALVGVAVALIMFFCGIEDPLLWGVIAFLLNYVPILGPLICGVLFVGVGLLSASNLSLSAALVPAGLYMIVHLIEGEAVTPMLLAKRFTLNPVLVVIMLVFWYWMWGVPGAVLSTPMLAIMKIVCDRIEGLKNFGHFIEG